MQQSQDLFATRSELATLLQLTPRRISQLVAKGVLKTHAPGLFNVRLCLKKYLAYRVEAEAEKLAPKANDKIRERRATMLERQMQREADQLIPIGDALEVFDDIAGAYLSSIASIPAQAALSGQARVDAEAIAQREADRLRGRFAAERQALKTGVAVGKRSEDL